MKFESLKKEVVFARERAQNFEAQCNRTWQLTDRLSVRIAVYGFGGGAPQLSISVEGVYAWNEPHGGQLVYIDRPISDLTMSDLRRVTMARNVFEQWIAGEIDELPTDPPDTSSAVA